MSELDKLVDKYNWSESGIRKDGITTITRQELIQYVDIKQARAKLEAMRAELEQWKSAYLSLEFDEVTGECLLGCGGSSVDGHNEDCIFILNLPGSDNSEQAEADRFAKRNEVLT